MASFTRDLRYALRMLRKSPGYTSIAMLTLAIGIGANTAIFSFVDGVLIKPLPYPDSDRIVRVMEKPFQQIRQAMGIAVFAGMLGVTVFGLFMTPVFYATVGGLVARWSARRAAAAAALPAVAPVEGH